jgi:hypothetical protein
VPLVPKSKLVLPLPVVSVMTFADVTDDVEIKHDVPEYDWLICPPSVVVPDTVKLDCVPTEVMLGWDAVTKVPTKLVAVHTPETLTLDDVVTPETLRLVSVPKPVMLVWDAVSRVPKRPDENVDTPETERDPTVDVPDTVRDERVPTWVTLGCDAVSNVPNKVDAVHGPLMLADVPEIVPLTVSELRVPTLVIFG